MGWTNNPKTNVQRVESWSSKQTLINKLNRIYKRLCCLTPDLYGGQGFVQRTLTTAELTDIFTTPILLVPGITGKLLFPSRVILAYTVPTIGFRGGVGYNDDFIIRSDDPGTTNPMYLARNTLSATSTFTISDLSAIDSPVANGVSQLVTDGGIEASINTGNPTVLLVPGVTDMTLEISLWYDIIDYATP